ncbi:hypothetical protein ACFFP0_24605 [Rhizobium puerariae]|uniref:Uncharacterized protein n=1 Tax=Rhizobium puerariae TaxID=1585791 RepID=A0ABV6ARV3_9HYPH
MTLVQLAASVAYYGNTLSKTPVSGTRYYIAIDIDTPTTITGVAALIGATGGTDSFIFELHDAAGVLVATTATAGVTVGTAGAWQRIPFTSAYVAQKGRYYIAVQINGTTARLAVYNAPTFPLPTGSATGTFGTGASITPPTTYTQAVGPVTALY